VRKPRRVIVMRDERKNGYICRGARSDSLKPGTCHIVVEGVDGSAAVREAPASQTRDDWPVLPQRATCQRDVRGTGPHYSHPKWQTTLLTAKLTRRLNASDVWPKAYLCLWRLLMNLVLPISDASRQCADEVIPNV